MVITEYSIMQDSHSLTVFYQQHDYITQLSFYKLCHPGKPRTEPTLRRQVLIRNILLSSMFSPLLHSTFDQQRSQEEIWLDACFDQLHDDDEPMEEDDHSFHDNGTDRGITHQEEAPNTTTLVLAVPFDYLVSTVPSKLHHRLSEGMIPSSSTSSSSAPTSTDDLPLFAPVQWP
ncbi:uncharacterized protein BYT42DRAFT_582842 [Radiomyces spectabilis]|uniref:uncharacterized protein n=1 Tax=Radiomyces spectabilis TaxID=64574 RepID=UPI0022202469|nr:uncharacterized protein BYT42DRAFT_582842 [Radiomyces spectabilis]KAI8370557.1 hypothetical protein BYT42DRAFT_582842 [Radiomyces spectabilis]